MPYKRNHKWYAQVRKEGQKRESVFLTKKEAIDWEADMRRKPLSELFEKTDITCIDDWAQLYLDFAETSFAAKTYKEKHAMFKRFLKHVDPTMAVENLKPAAVIAYVMAQKAGRSGCAANKDRKNLVAAWNWGMKYMDPPPTRPESLLGGADARNQATPLCPT